MTDYSIIYLVAIVSVLTCGVVAGALYFIDRNADRNDKHS
jgi:hypothetical protein